MRTIIAFLLLLLLGACSEIPRPQNLVSEDEMASIFVDYALYDNAPMLGQRTDMEGVSKFILDKYHVTGEQYLESYKYYLAHQKIDDIVKRAKEKLYKLDPKLKKYIEEKETPLEKLDVKEKK